MKLLVTTATAALFGAGVAFAAGTMANIDTDASGSISLEEAQAYDPSVTAEAFGDFDANADAALDDAEFAAWESAMASADGQGDAGIDADAGVDDSGVSAGADTDADLGADLDTDAGGADLGAGADAGADLELEAE